MKKALLCCLLTFFFCFINQDSNLLLVCAEPTSSNKEKTNEKRLLQTQQSYDDDDGVADNIKCIDLADFYYEIILGVSSFPEQGTCNDQEEAEIAALLQKTINTELQAIPGTIKTQNKVCESPINTRRRRRRLMLPQNGSLSFSREQHPYHQNTEEMTSNERNLVTSTRKGRRAFVYVGGGRCRYCFLDNYDARLLSSTITKRSTTKQRMLERSTNNKYSDRRNLLYIAKFKYRSHFDKVADILLCDEIGQNKMPFAKDSLSGNQRYPKYAKWINAKEMTMRAYERRSKQYKPMHFVGPYAAGDSFGAQIDMNEIARSNKQVKAKYEKKGTEMVEFPVRGGIIEFYLYCFDLPADVSRGVFFDDNPIVIFVNGIKLDFKLLMSESGRWTKMGGAITRMDGDSFAGITWEIVERTNWIRYHYSYGPQLDKVYSFRIKAPMVVLDHKNLLDIDFILRPNAPAKKYALREFQVILQSAHCEVTGLEHSPFDDFQNVVESRLFHKLGVDLAHAFQGKQGHCLYDKIPVVNVNLVQKETWKDSKPNCG